MRRKNRKWVAAAVVLYLFVMWSAYRWGKSQILPGGSIFLQIQHEASRQQIERLAREGAEEARTRPTRESRLPAAGPAFVAARYDATHVVFLAVSDTESRFSASPLIRAGTFRKVSAPSHTAAPLAGLQEVWEPDSQSLHFFPEIVQKTQPGEQWVLNLSPDSTIPVVIERPIIAPAGCSLGMGFLASVPAEQQAVFAATAPEYFVVRRNAVESADPPVAAHISELPAWKESPHLAQQIEQLLNQRMKEEVANIDARLLANAGSPGQAAGELPVGSARPHLKEWLHADQGLTRGEGTLDYDVRAFRLTPDGAPRLFVRARWKLAGAAVFLMTAWFKADAQPVLLFADSNWSLALREGETSVSLGDRLDFQSILNEFDADHDGWAELLIHSYEVSSYQGAATAITLYAYSDAGLIPLKAPLRRDNRSPESCLDP